MICQGIPMLGAVAGKHIVYICSAQVVFISPFCPLPFEAGTAGKTYFQEQ